MNLAGREDNGRLGSVHSAVVALGRVVDAIHERREAIRSIGADAEAQRLAAAAPETARAARIRPDRRSHITTGESCSMTSAGTPAMPLGKAVACRPSLVGRAPVPPQENQT